MAADELVGLRFFDRLPEWALEGLARSAAKRWCEPSTLVARQSEEARAVYFLLSGAVQVLVYFVGMANLASAAAVLLGNRWGAPASVVVGITWMGWFVVQVAVVGFLNWQQPAYFVVGVLIIVLAARLWRTARAG